MSKFGRCPKTLTKQKRLKHQNFKRGKAPPSWNQNLKMKWKNSRVETHLFRSKLTAYAPIIPPNFKFRLATSRLRQGNLPIGDVRFRRPNGELTNLRKPAIECAAIYIEMKEKNHTDNAFWRLLGDSDNDEEVAEESDASENVDIPDNDDKDEGIEQPKIEEIYFASEVDIDDSDDVFGREQMDDAKDPLDDVFIPDDDLDFEEYEDIPVNYEGVEEEEVSIGEYLVEEPADDEVQRDDDSDETEDDDGDDTENDEGDVPENGEEQNDEDYEEEEEEEETDEEYDSSEEDTVEDSEEEPEEEKED